MHLQFYSWPVAYIEPKCYFMVALSSVSFSAILKAYHRRRPCEYKILHALEIDQRYLAHTPSVTGVPQKILIVKIKNRASNSAY